MSGGLPEGYRLISCLRSDEGGETCLCAYRGEQVIVKTTRDEDCARQLRNEYETLRALEGTGLAPRPMELREGEETLLCREYLPGLSVEEFLSAQEKPGLPPTTAVGFAVDVLWQLKALHALPAPIIHRDVKPQNVIVSPADADGERHCRLIDFGIARHISQDRRGDADTMVMGTQLTAPPEQFGFQQTDRRSDIYACGVLLRYMLTGEYRPEADEGIRPGLRRVIKKATAFDPRRRYQSAEAMLRALKNAQTPGKKRRLILGAALITACVLTALLCLLPRDLHFQEPLIEAAVRRALQMPDGALTEADLTRVTQIRIFGKQIYDSEEQIWFLGEQVYIRDDALRENGLWSENGGIRTLKDLKRLPNLKEVCLYNQDITSLDTLKGTGITGLGIGYNPLKDLTPLADMPGLTYLNIACLDAGAEAVLPALTALRSLCASGVPFPSFDCLTGLPLETLNLFGSGDGCDWTALARIGTLRDLTINKLDWHILDAIRQMELESLTVTHGNGIPFANLAGLTTLKKLYFMADEQETLSPEPADLPEVRWLDIKNTVIPSFACLAGMPKLDTLCIYASECLDYAGLEALQELKTIYCTQAQAEAIAALYPDRHWTLNCN